MKRIRALSAVVVCASVVAMSACGGGATVDEGAQADLAKVDAGYVSALDQIGLPVGVEGGYFEERGLDVKLAQPFPTGVDALNALQSGDVDFVQVGTPAIGAAQKGIDLVLLGNYTGSASRRSIDETMAVVTRKGVQVDEDELSTLKGKRIGVSEGSINHLYLLGLLDEAGLSVEDVKIVNTAPPDMGVALQTKGIDVAIVWDPWPLTITNQVDGSTEAIRGGGYIPFVGYLVALRSFVEKNPKTVKRFLAARAAVDQWMRKNPKQAAESATRWIPGLKPDVATESMKYNVKQLDPRLSACNYLALDTVARMLAKQKAVRPGFDVGDHFLPASILAVAKDEPKLFDDLPPVPDAATIDADYRFDRSSALRACPSG